MTTLFFSYKDLARLAWNYLSLQVKFQPSGTDDFYIVCSLPRTGVRNLLIEATTNLELTASLEVKSEKEIKISVLNILSSCMELQQVLVQYINHHIDKPLLHLNFLDEIFVYLNDYDIRIQSIKICRNGLKIQVKNDAAYIDRIRMIRMLLRAGYEHVHSLSVDDNPHSCYFFSDDSLEYCLNMASHPADISFHTTIPMPEWLVDDIFRKDMQTTSGRHVHTTITMQNDCITINMPIVIAEKQFNAKTIKRAVRRIQDEVKPLLLDMLFRREKPPLDDETISLDGFEDILI